MCRAPSCVIMNSDLCSEKTPPAAKFGYLQPGSPVQKLAVMLLSLPHVCTELLQQALGFVFTKHGAQQVGFHLQQAEPLLQLYAVFQELLPRKETRGA